jgi:hypothetical protein
MPTYCYINEDGEREQLTFPIGAQPAKVKINGKVARRDYQAEAVGVPPAAGWPIECIASGVHADDAGKLKKYLADRGVKTEITPNGNPVYRNASHRRKAFKARGLMDKAAFV